MGKWAPVNNILRRVGFLDNYWPTRYLVTAPCHPKHPRGKWWQWRHSWKWSIWRKMMKKSISESCGIDFDKLCSAAHLKILVTYCGADATRTKCSRKRLHWGCIRTGCIQYIWSFCKNRISSELGIKQSECAVKKKLQWKVDSTYQCILQSALRIAVQVCSVPCAVFSIQCAVWNV